MNLNNYDWYCDNCNAYLNSQLGFNTGCGVWYCKKCGEGNSIHQADIIDEYDYNDFKKSGFDSYNDYASNRDLEDSLSVSDAALIWASHGKDENYNFGYLKDELEDAL